VIRITGKLQPQVIGDWYHPTTNLVGLRVGPGHTLAPAN
jgi:hypothetical protein